MKQILLSFLLLLVVSFMNAQGQMNLQLVDGTGRLTEQRSYRYDGCRRIELFDLSSKANGLYYVIAELTPGQRRSDNLEVIRRNGLKVVKISN
jgi:hypothetical protein